MSKHMYVDPGKLDPPRFTDVLKRRMAERDLTQHDLAGRIGVSQAFVSAMLTGKKTPGRKTLEVLLEALDIDWSEVTSEPAATLPVVVDGKKLTAAQLKQFGLFIIPHLNIEASAGNGAEVYFEEQEGETILPEWYIRQRFKAPPDRVKRIRVTGNSMVPTVYPGQHVFVVILDPGEDPVHGGIYVMQSPHGILFKRLYYHAETDRESDRTRDFMRIHSDNPEAGEYRLPLEVFRRDYRLIAHFRVAECEL